MHCLIDPYGKQGILTEGGRISTIDLLVLTNLDQLILVLNIFFLFYKTSYLNKEVNCTEPSTSERVPRLMSCTY